MTDDLRRRDDVMLIGLDKRLALLEQAHTLRAEADAARQKVLEATLASLAAKVDAAIGLWQAVTAEPAASPAGRALLADVTALQDKVEEHEDFVQQTNGAFRLARLALGTSLLAAVGTIVAIAGTLGRP